MEKGEQGLLEKIWAMLQGNTKELTKISSHVAVLNREMGEVKDDIKDIKNGMKSDIKEVKDSVDKEIDAVKEDYVTKVEFSPVKRIVYTLIGAISMAVLVALLSLVIR